MIHGSNPAAALRDNAKNQERLAAEDAEIADARKRFDMATRNLSGPATIAIQNGTVTDAECAASPVVAAARNAWRDYLALTGGAITGEGNIHFPS